MKSYVNVFSSLQPMILLSRISGVTYFRQNSKWIALYRLLVLSILTLCLAHEIPTVAFWIGSSRSLHAVLTAFETSLRWTLVFFNNILTAFRSPEINSTVSNLNKLKLDVDQSAFKRTYRFQIFQTCFNLFLISCFMILGHHFIWYNINKQWYTALIYIFTEFYIAFGNMQFSAFAYLFGEYFKSLNKKLLSMGKWMENEERFNLQNRNAKCQLNDLRENHLKLSRLTSKLNGCYTVQLLFFTLLSFVEIVYSLRAFFLHIVNKRSSDVWKRIPVLAFFHMSFWGGYYFLAVMQIVALCDRISKHTSLIVHKILNKIQHPDLERELELFSMQIRSNEAKFVACGFFKLDFALIHSIIAAVTTYLVVLISIREDTDTEY